RDRHQREQGGAQRPVQGAHEPLQEIQQPLQDHVHRAAPGPPRNSSTVAASRSGMAARAALAGVGDACATTARAPIAVTGIASGSASGYLPSSQPSNSLRAIGAAVEPP